MHISAKYENPKMFRKGGHNCPTYQMKVEQSCPTR